MGNLMNSAGWVRIVAWALLLVLGAPGLGTTAGHPQRPDPRPRRQPGRRIRLVFKSDTDGKEYTAEPSDELGKYSINLPVNHSYVLVAAIAPDGTRCRSRRCPRYRSSPEHAGVDVRFGSARTGATGRRCSGNRFDGGRNRRRRA